LLGVALFHLAACSKSDEPDDLVLDAAPVTTPDAAAGPDASTPSSDAAAPTPGNPEAGSTALDANGGTSDSGAVAADASVASDATSPSSDATADAGDAALSDASTEPPPHPGDKDKSILPIVFLHGFAGSASQFDSQAQRFVLNGYPPNKLHAFDHDGASLTTTAFEAPLDQLISGLLTEFGVTQIYLIGHSRGTFLANGYLGNAARAKKVAKVILLDGAGCSLGGSVPCDTPNQSNLPGQSHVEVSTSPESFKRQYKFLLGKEPTVVDIVAQQEPVLISGRAVNFPANTGRSGATLNVFELDENGQRAGAALKTQPVDTSGNFGPLLVSPTKRYEFALTLENGVVQHYYFQNFLRSTKFIRLLSGPIDSPSRVNTNTGPNHAALTLMRMREWYTTDTMKIVVSRAAGETSVPNAITADVANDKIAIYLHDDKATPGMTTLKPLPYFPGQPFQTGLDVFMPAAEEPDGTITLTNQPRGNASKPQVLKFPNWASSKHSITVNFADFAQ
jgi:pimeloyl-ACP methyl ester carboxylesterase